MKKTISTLLFLLLFALGFEAQNKFDKLWIKVEQFEIENLPKSALKIVQEIYTKADKVDNTPQVLKALIYKSKFSITLEENAQLSIINNFKKHIDNAKSPTKNILQNMLANLYWDYFKQNRYKFYNRTKTNKKVDENDFRTWDLDTLFKEIITYYQASLQQEKLLKEINIEKFKDILILQETSKTYTPTLFDFLANKALDFYKTSENSITKPAYQFHIDNTDYLGKSSNFIKLKINSIDSLSLELSALKTFQKLINLHTTTGNKNALANVDIQRLNFVYQKANINKKDSILLNTLQASKIELKNHQASRLYAFEIAKIYKNQSNNRGALKICNTIIKTFPKSFGAKKCIILKKQIEYKTLSIRTEEYVPIDKNSRLLVTYKNIKKLHFTAYKISQKEKEKFDKLYQFKDRKAFINTLIKVTTWKHQLRDEGDYLQHSTEIVVPKFNNGMYLIIASENGYLQEKSIYGTSIIQATNLTLIENVFQGKYTYQIVDRNTGKPIPKAQIQLKNNNNHEDYYINKKLTTDQQGFVSFKARGYYSNVQINVNTKNDVAYFGKSYLSNYRRSVDNDEDDEIILKPFIFTDRSIYRPGQTVYFKTIVIKKQGSASEVFKDEYVEVTLYDVNNQVVNTLDLKLNEFGSVAGKFELPDNGLTGEYEIQIDESFEYDSKFYDNTDFEFAYNSAASFSVEEYKRPKFETQFKPVTESYKINDSITVNGFAKAFSGANITDAKVKYRVFRKVQYPAWYYWRRPNTNSSAQEIINGESSTDASGNFSIKFRAIPDESVSKENLPIFTYEVTADVTDINGETRSASSTVKVGYHSLLAKVSIDDKVDKNQKETTISIDTKNLNDQFVSAKGGIKIYKLVAPKHPLRKRPWGAPDYQDISENTFRTLFPNDPYTNDESDTKNWKKGALVFSSDFDTNISKEIKLTNHENWVSGKYIITIESKDKFNQKVKDEKRFTLFSNQEKEVADAKLFTINTDKPFYTSDDDVLLTVSSASKDITVVIQVEKDFKIVDTQLIKLNNTTKTIKIPVTKNDVGGFAIKYHFVSYNYFQSGNIIINVPKKRENITIETNTFRDKLQPGQEETWSFTIKNDKNDTVAAEVLASMYDASLDEFKSHNWNFNHFSSQRNYYSYRKSNAGKSFGTTNFYIRNQQRSNYKFPQIRNNQYNWFGFSINNYRWKNHHYLNEISRRHQTRKANLKSTYTSSGNFNGTITGKITDSEGSPLPGASIWVKGTKNNATSDFDGNFSIKAKKGNVLVFSYLGFKSIAIKTSNYSNLNVALAEEASHLDEVVVVGYGTQKKKMVTGSISTVTAQMTYDSIIESILKGQVAGVSINNSSGQPGSSDNIVIRGVSSLKSKNKPLYIIDGIPVEEFDMDADGILEIDILKDKAATSLYGARAANGVILINTKAGQKKIEEELDKVQSRKNFKETAFFYPQLQTDKNGKVSFNFTMPEALTRWKLQLLAHTQDVKSAKKTLTAITQKELMVVPNAPRFLREKDTIILSAKISNITNNKLSGFAKIYLSDAISGKSITKELLTDENHPPLSESSGPDRVSFSVGKDGNTNVSWRLKIPTNVQSIQYKIVATTGVFSDGEQNILPVLTNRMLVTETLPMWVKSNETKTFTLDKMRNQSSSTLQHYQLTLEMTSNPAWYAIQSLPYLMEYPYECAEQTFSKYYANTLASYVANSNPKIQEVFNSWKNTDALLSNLEKNKELKSLLIQETPWLRDAQSETEQKKRIGLLFDLTRMKNQQKKTINKLKDIQLNSGGFPWFKGGRYPSKFITQHIATGFGHLRKLGVSDFDKSTKNVIEKSVKFLDDELIEQYQKLLKRAEKIKKEKNSNQKTEKKSQAYLAKNNLNYFTIQYLYMRSFYDDIEQNDDLKAAINYYQNQIKEYWNDYNLYAKGQIALSLFRNDKKEAAYKIIKSLKENSITSDELGMYWKENTAGFYYYQAPVETQSLLIEAFSEIDNNNNTIDNLKIWLLKNKETNSWKTTKATSNAIYALLLSGSNWLTINKMVDISIGDKKINPSILPNVKVEVGTGYFKTSWDKSEIKPEMATVSINKKSEGIAWGGLYWQYFEDLDKITSVETPLKINKKLFKKVNSNSGKELQEITKEISLKVGDLITVSIELRSDRTMEFIHLKDMRASGVEPINVISKYKWKDNLGYYESTKDASTNFFFDRLPKGIYVFEYDVRVNNAGNFSNGISTIQSMYAPEFSSHSEGVRLQIEE